ncbi:MAG: hypothetical protein JOY54_21420 [Acidobacteriaceae bacterium]|nr:hypothetical protein [Acidobacteriaceae bacterium]
MTDSLLMGGHGPFRGLDAPLALVFLYHRRKQKGTCGKAVSIPRKEAAHVVPSPL